MPSHDTRRTCPLLMTASPPAHGCHSDLHTYPPDCTIFSVRLSLPSPLVQDKGQVLAWHSQWLWSNSHLTSEHGFLTVDFETENCSSMNRTCCFTPACFPPCFPTARNGGHTFSLQTCLVPTRWHSPHHQQRCPHPHSVPLSPAIAQFLSFVFTLD